MANVIFSSELQRLTGEEHTCVIATNYRDLVAELLNRYEKLTEDEILNMAVSIDGEIIHDPLLEAVSPESEVHFLFRISGG
ncbi:MAG: MoaD/ThiS family protein [Proteobacteria bacterium]|nr:MoaD/ThiS family protein [Pseudomonadota bacterium]